MNFHGEFSWSRLATVASVETGFVYDSGANHVHARVEQAEPDGVATLRVGSGLVLFDADGTPPPDLVGSVLRLDAVTIDVFPTGI